MERVFNRGNPSLSNIICRALNIEFPTIFPEPRICTVSTLSAWFRICPQISDGRQFHPKAQFYVLLDGEKDRSENESNASNFGLLFQIR
jgi:hypothetical protein